jgi:hypothetical protein
MSECCFEFQCPNCGYEISQTIESLRAQNHFRCSGCSVAINVDSTRLSNVVDEIRNAVEKTPPEITIKFYS